MKDISKSENKECKFKLYDRIQQISNNVANFFQRTSYFYFDFKLFDINLSTFTHQTICHSSIPSY